MALTAPVLEMLSKPSYLKVLPQLKAHLITDAAQFRALQPSWNTLQREATPDNMALSHAWLCGILNCFPRTPVWAVCVFNEQNELVGAAPLSIRKGQDLFRLRRLCFMGDAFGLYDQVNFLVKPGAGQSAILELMFKTILEHRKDWDYIGFNYFMDAEQQALFTKRMTQQNLFTVEEVSHEIPTFALNGSLEYYTESAQSKWLKKDTKRLWKKFSKEESDSLKLEVFEISSKSDELEIARFKHEATELMQTFFMQHRQYWKEKTGFSNFEEHSGLDVFYHKMVLESALAHRDDDQQCRLVLSVLRCDKGVLSYQLGSLYETRYDAYMSSYHPEYGYYRPGLLQMDALAKHFAEQGYRTFSLGRGYMAYKELWHTEKQFTQNVLVFQQSAWKWLYESKTQLKQRAKGLKASLQQWQAKRQEQKVSLNPATAKA
jgi:CelD/BcsL family acetyltransferase involved in cellulose biosynthesis